MGKVYRAYDTRTDREVALKLLPPELAEDEAFQQRFRREAHAVAHRACGRLEQGRLAGARRAHEVHHADTGLGEVLAQMVRLVVVVLEEG
ncbi:MAG TPA: hypothetical protein PK413_21155, partial [Thermoanaerobaculia bacterium]|nr:hypothetical protein [Thermoanaerobaculia bacterium]